MKPYVITETTIRCWTLVCETCRKEGPEIRSVRTGLTFGSDHRVSTDLFKQWLDDHVHHDVRLRGEDVPPVHDESIRLSGAGPLVVGLAAATAPGTRQIISNRGNEPIVIRETENEGLSNRFAFPSGVSEVVVAFHSTAAFVAKKPTRWQRLWGRLTGRPPQLRWKWDRAASKAPDEGGIL